MPDQFARTKMLLGQQGMERLKSSRIAVFGVGGVGGYAAEALARSGVGALDLIDHDSVSLTNLNRQIYALHYYHRQVKNRGGKRTDQGYQSRLYRHLPHSFLYAGNRTNI